MYVSFHDNAVSFERQLPHSGSGFSAAQHYGLSFNFEVAGTSELLSTLLPA
jgi:hypothetical protein